MVMMIIFCSLKCLIIFIGINEKGTLKATGHDKYEHIAGSVYLSLFTDSNGNEYYCPRRLAPG
jgi:hypothetical protein